MAAPVAVASSLAFFLPSQTPSYFGSSAVVGPPRVLCTSSSSRPLMLPSVELIFRHRPRQRGHTIPACLASTSAPESSFSENRPSEVPATRLFVSGLSFRTNQESLSNAFRSFGQLKEVHLVMDKVANRSKGFAFLKYATEDEARRAIEGMHGKFLDGRVIFVEVARPRSEVRRHVKQTPRLF